jgi:hypothetical protein
MSRSKRASDPPSATQLRHTPYTQQRERDGQPFQKKESRKKNQGRATRLLMRQRSTISMLSLNDLLAARYLGANQASESRRRQAHEQASHSACRIVIRLEARHGRHRLRHTGWGGS